MDSLREFAAVTMAEMRSSRRLVRTWMFIALSVLVGLLMYLYYVVLHGMFSGLSSTFGFLNPRFLISASSFMVIAISNSELELELELDNYSIPDGRTVNIRNSGSLSCRLGGASGRLVLRW